MVVAGLFNLKINGILMSAKGNFTYNHGGTKNEAQVSGNGEIVGFKTSRTIPMIEGELIDTKDLDIKAVQAVRDGEIILELANGKVFVLIGSHWAGDGNVQTEEANFAIKFEGIDSEEFAA